MVIGIPCLLHGGTERQTLSLVQALAGWADEIIVVCYFEHEPTAVRDFEDSGARVQLLRLSRKISPWRLIAALRRTFRSIRPGVIHIQYIAPGLLPVVAARMAGVPRVLATVHQPGTAYGSRARWLLRTAAWLCDRFICVSHAAEISWFGGAHPRSTRGAGKDSWPRRSNHCTIHNGIDLARVDAIRRQEMARNRTVPCPRTRPPGRTSLVIGAVARLRREKGVDLMLQALPEVLRQIPAARLLVIGDGPDESLLKAQSAELGVAARVRWTGFQTWERVIQLISTVDMVVVPSRFEGFGLSAAEAMACGKPVIAANVDGLAEVIGTEGAGVLVRPEDPTALSEALVTLWNNPGRRLAMMRAARSRAEQQFSFEVYRSRILGVYSDLAGNIARI